MSEGEFPRLIDVGQAVGRRLHLVAGEGERQALARRFGLVRIDRLEADVTLTGALTGEAAGEGGAIAANGRLSAAVVQSCAISGEDLAVMIDEPLHFRFVPAAQERRTGEEVEIDADACDEIAFSGTRFDLGEAVAQSLALAIDPFAEGPGADEARRRAGLLDEGDAGPFAALKGLAGKA